MKFFDLVKEKLSTLLSMWLLIILVASLSIYIQDGYINRDGLLYLKQAYLFAEGSWKAGLALYPWPFFSILIAVFHKLTNLHLQVIAHGVDLALFGISTLFYLKTLKLIYNKEKKIIFYGGIVLLSFIPIMDDYIGMVLRDHGLWAGCMMGTYFYFKNIKENSMIYSIAWQFGFLFGGLFRPEGLIFLILLPLWNFTQNKSLKFKRLIHDYSLNIMILILGLLVIFLSNFDLISLINSSRLTEFFKLPIQFFSQLIRPLPFQTEDIFLAKLLEDYSLVITYSVLLTILIFKWIKGLGLFHGSLFIFSFYAKMGPVNNFKKHIYLFLVVSFILVSINLFNVYVLTNRYWGVHWWWMFLLLTSTLVYFFEGKNIDKRLKYFISAFILLLIANVFFDKTENLEKEIARYISNKNISMDVNFKNNERIAYYVFKNPDYFFQEKDEHLFKYNLVKLPSKRSIDHNLIIESFPERNPKYILITND